MNETTTTATEPASAPAGFNPDQLQRIVDHLNEDHADAVLGYARHFGRRPLAQTATLLGLDFAGLDVLVREPTGEHLVRVAFEPPLAAASEAHARLVQMARTARAALPSASNRAGTAVPAGLDPARRDRALAALTHLRTSLRTLSLATVSAEGLPDSSVAPFVIERDDTLWTYLSELSPHTANLRATHRAAVLLVEDEATAAHPLARRRLALTCLAKFVARDRPEFPAAMAPLRERFGAVMEHLQTLHDFHLVRLQVTHGRLIAGFGQAYDVEPHDWTALRPVGEQGHRSAPAATGANGAPAHSRAAS
jgi:putative heme iron utilization protein